MTPAERDAEQLRLNLEYLGCNGCRLHGFCLNESYFVDCAYLRAKLEAEGK